MGAAGELDYGFRIPSITGVDEGPTIGVQAVGYALRAVFARSPSEAAPLEAPEAPPWPRGSWEISAGLPPSNHLPQEPQKRRKGSGPLTENGRDGLVLPMSLAPNLRQKRNGITSTVWSPWKWVKNTRFTLDGVDAEAPHAAHRTEAEVEDERLLPCLDHYAALPPPKAQRGGASADDRDVDFGNLPPSVVALRKGGVSVSSLRLRSNALRAPILSHVLV